MNIRGMEQHNWLQNGFFTGWLYTIAKTSPVVNFMHELTNDMVANMTTIFAKVVFRRSSFVGKPQTLNKKLGLQRTPT